MRLNKKLEFLQESATLRLNAEANALRAKGARIINLTAGELDFDTPEYLQKALKKQLHYNKYTPTLGLPELRALLARKITREHGRPVASDEIAVTAGAKQALYELLQVLLNPGDEVIIPTPAWGTYEVQVRLAGGKPVFSPLAPDFDLDVADIRKKLDKKTKVIILNFPHNPTGKIFSQSALKALARLLTGRDVFVVFDGVYQQLIYNRSAVNRFHLPFQRPALITVGSFSKSQALAGWRIGYLAADRRIIERIGGLQSHLSSNASVVAQRAAITALQSGEPIGAFVSALKQRRALVLRLLHAIPNIAFQEPDGAFYFFIDVRKVDPNSERFCRLLLKKKKVMLVPGDVFYAKGFVRLSFAASDDALKQGIQRIKEYIAEHQ